MKPDPPRAVTRLAITLPDGETPGSTLALSPDGTRVAYTANTRTAHVWVWDFARATLIRVTSDPAPDREPAWTPDSKRLIFTSWRTGVISLFT